MKQLLTSLFILPFLLIGCGGGESTDELSTVGRAVNTIRDASSCSITLNQNDTNINTLLETTCAGIFSDALKNDGKKWSVGRDSTCGFIAINASKEIMGVPKNNHVGSCMFELYKTKDDTITISTVNLTITNKTPDLNIADTVILEDVGEVVIRTDAEVQADEEGYGTYSLDNVNTSGTKCSDNGTLSINASNGEVRFYSNLNYFGNCNVKVLFDDKNSSGSTVVFEFVLGVTGVNDAPVVSGSCTTTSLNQDIGYTCTGVTASDVENDSLVWSTDTAHTCSWLNVNSSTGEVTGTPDDDDVGSCTLAIKTNDGTIDSNIYTETINVLNVTPVLNDLTNTLTITEDDPATTVITDVNVSADEEGFGIYSLDNVNTSGTKCSDNGSVSINSSTGAVSFTPAANYFGDCQVRVVFDDQNPTGNTVFKEATISVTGVNDLPVITSACTLSVDELASYSCAGSATDVENDIISWSLDGTNTCTWASIDPSSGNITGTPDRSDVGACNLVVLADDGTDTTTKTYAISVNNLVPIVTVSDTNLTEDSGLTIIRTGLEVTSTDEGFGSYSIGTAASNDCGSHGTIAIDSSNGEVSFSPDADYDQNCNIRVVFDDGQALNNIGFTDFTLTMNPLPDNAIVSLPSSCNDDINEDVLYSCTPVLTDPDTGDTHTWSIDNNTCPFISSIATATGVMSGTAIDDEVGSCTFTIKATGDQDGLITSTLTASFNIVNVQPVLSVTSPVNIQQRFDAVPTEYAASVKNSSSTIDITSTDESYGVFSLGTASSNDCAADMTTYSIDSSTGVITIYSNDLFSGSCNIAVEFDDQNSIDNTATVLEFPVTFVDEVPPLISYLDSSSPDATYLLGSDVNITVKFNEPVSINVTAGTPRIFLETGAVDRTAFYDSMSADQTEVYFTYTVGDDDSSTDLEVHSSVTFLDLAGSTFADLAGNTLPNFPIPQASDLSGNSLSERRNIVIDGTVANVDVAGLPSRVSPDLFLNIAVSGASVVEYQYKVSEVGDANYSCDDSTGYSSNIDVSTNISDDISSYALGSELVLCIVGVTSDNVVQPYTQAFEYLWSRDDKVVQRISFSGVTDLPNWQDGEVDPDNPNIVYARNLLGEVYKSVDYGSSWEKYCTIPQSYNADLVVSPGPDRTAYVFQAGSIYRISNQNGASCTNITDNGGLDVFKNDYNNQPVGITNTGDIYVATASFGAPIQVWRSFDRGESWYYYMTLPNATSANPDYVFSFAISPVDPSRVAYSKQIGSNDITRGYYFTEDAGENWSLTASLYEGRKILYHPTEANIVYRMDLPFHQISIDSGNTWSGTGMTWLSTQYGLNNRTAIDIKSGKAYRLNPTVAGVTILEVSSDITTSGTHTWSTVYTFNSDSGVVGSGMNVSVSGNESDLSSPTILVNLLDRMWISTDGGSSFQENFSPDELQLVTIAGAGDDAIYGATKDWRVVKTSDNGESWEYKTGDYHHCLGTPPRLSVNFVNTNNILMWADNFASINCDTFNYSVNGMNSLIQRDDFSMIAGKTFLSTSPHDAKTFYIAGKPANQDFRFNQTYNYGYESIVDYASGLELSDPTPDSYIHPHSNQYVWAVNNDGTGNLYEYNLLDTTRKSLNGSLSLSSIAAIDVYTGDLGQFYLRVMDRAGRMQVSTDYGESFSDEGTTGAPLTSCDKRFLYHHPRDRNLVVTACVLGNTIGVSSDSGTTWDETDLLTDYDISCSITGVAISSSRIYIGCRDADTFIFNYSFASLENDVADSVLTASETSVATDLVNHYFPGNYLTIEYAVIPAGDTCNSGVSGFSTTVPTTQDAAFTVRGEYKICIKQEDLANNFSYVTTSTIFYDANTPVFTSIDLINSASDGEINLTEHYFDEVIVGNLSSSNHDFVKYSVTESANTCDSSLEYDYKIPKANTEKLKSSGSYKVCVELITRGDESRVYGSSSTFTFNTTQVFATVSNMPAALISTDTALNATVGGVDVTQYRYALGLDDSLDCADISNYSVSTPIATPISENLSGFTHGDYLKLCVIGGDSSNNFQATNLRTIKRWYYSTGLNIYPVDFSSISLEEKLTSWRQVEVHASNENIIYALNSLGEVWRTQDKGSSWHLQCKIKEYRSNMRLIVSPASDATAYISHYFRGGTSYYNNLWRVDSVESSDCSSLGGSFREFNAESTYIKPLITLNSSGHLFVLENQYDSVVIRKSVDYGKTWLLVGQLQDGGLNGSLFISPLDENIMLITTRSNNSGTGTRGLWKSVDGGATWNYIRTTGFDGQLQINFDTVNSGRVYSTSGYVSNDNGSSWSSDSAFNTNLSIWDIDSTGAGYTLSQSGSDTLLSKSNSLNPASFSTLYTFSNISATENKENFVSVSGSTIAVVVGEDRLFISTDSGSSFNEVFWPGKNLAIRGMANSDGNNIYMTAKGNTLLKTTDSAQSWQFVFDDLDTGCENEERVYAHPIDSNYAVMYYDNCKVKGWASNNGFSSYNDYDVVSGVVEGFFMAGSSNLNQFSQMANFSSGNNPNFYETINLWANTFKSATTKYGQWGNGVNNNRGVVGFSMKDKASTYFVIDDSNNLLKAKIAGTMHYININNKLRAGNAAGMALEVLDRGLDTNLFVMGTTGLLNYSSDDAENFVNKGTSTAPFGSCYEFIFYVNPNNSNYMVAGCNEANQLGYSLDGGGSWTTLNLESEFGISCTLNSVIMTNSEIYFSCDTSLPAMTFSFTPIKLIGNARDNRIIEGEANGSSLVKVDHPENWVSINYAIISNGGDCSVSTSGFSSTVPIDTDLTIDGDYQICVALNDGSSTVYATSTEIHFSQTAPVFTSIDLVNDAVDGIQLVDHIYSSSDIVGNLNASDYTTAYYALVSDTTVCDINVNYKSSIPNSNDTRLELEGDYKVCVALSDGINDPVYAESSSFTVNYSTVTATLSGLPDKVSSETTLSVNVSGADVSHYQYKVAATTLDCADSSGYSGDIAIATEISDDISGFADGAIHICVRGIDSVNGHDQLYANATKYSWNKSDIRINSAKFNIASYHESWFDVEVSKWSADTYIYARDFEGNIFLSKDRGASFSLACKVSFDANSKMMISPLKEKGAFVAANSNLYRIDELDGEDCPSVSSSFTEIRHTYQRAPIAFRSNGDIYAIDQESITQSVLKRSNSLGANWTTIYTFTETFLGAEEFRDLSVYVDPFDDDNIMVVYQGDSNNFSGDLIVSRNGGISFQGISMNSGARSVVDLQNLEINIKFDHANEGYFYGNNGFYSRDNMYNLTDGIGDYPDDLQRWDLDRLGVGYRLIQNGADLNIEKAPDMTNASFSVLDTLSSITADIYNRSIAVSYDGATKAIVADKKMFISLDDGAFNPVLTPIVEHILSSVSSEDNNVIYGIDANWQFTKSSDGGASWSTPYSLSTGCSKLPRVRASKANNNYVYAFAEETGVGTCTGVGVSTDALSTMTLASVAGNWATEIVFPMNPSDETNAAIIGAETIIETNDSFSSVSSYTTTTSISTSNHGFDGFISPLDNSLMYYVSAGSMIEVDSVSQDKFNITSSLTMSDPAAIEGFSDGSVYVISRTGQLDYSTNAAGSFVALTSDPGLTTCSARLLKAAAGDPSNVIVTGCNNGSRVAYTKDGGSTWVEINLTNYTYSASCVIRDMAIKDNTGNYELYIACKDRNTLVLKMD